MARAPPSNATGCLQGSMCAGMYDYVHILVFVYMALASPHRQMHAK